MSFHIKAKKEEVSDKVLLPGDPLRAKYIAETFLESPKAFNSVRGMEGFTGKYQGKTVSVHPTGMGIPSTMIYVNELISEFGVKSLVRVGTCGAINPNVQLRDIIMAQAACTDSGVLPRIFGNLNFAPCASFQMLLNAHQYAEEKKLKRVHIGNILSTDTFYPINDREFQLWQDHQVLVSEMETSALYTIAAKNKVSALTLLTVSDLIFSPDKKLNDQEKEKDLNTMIQMALSII